MRARIQVAAAISAYMFLFFYGHLRSRDGSVKELHIPTVFIIELHKFFKCSQSNAELSKHFFFSASISRNRKPLVKKSFIVASASETVFNCRRVR